MGKLRAVGAGVAALALAVSATFTLAAKDPEVETKPKNTTSTGMGMVCWTAMIELVSHVGKTCVEDENPEVRAELNRATTELRKVLIKAGMSQEQLQAFLDRQADHAVPDEQLCANEGARRFYTSFADAGPEELAKTTDEVLAFDGPPIWGTCL